MLANAQDRAHLALYASRIKRWSTAVLVFFAWGFVMHGTGLLLHEFGGHGLAAVVLGCGIDAYGLTFFGHGQVHRAPCEGWTWSRLLVVDWSGLVLTSAVGALAAWLLRTRRHWPPMRRLLVALVAFFFLLGQLGYATTGGFHDLYDPGRTARWLGAHGVHVLAWTPPLVLYAASAVFCAREAVEAYREHFGTRTRLRTLGHLSSTLGVAGVLYYAAFLVEWRLRTDLEMRGVEVRARELAIERHVAPPFPIDKVLLGIALAALIWAFARPVRGEPEPRPFSPRLLGTVAVSAAGCFLLMLLLVLRSRS